ncbi:MAG TPA: RluA family pseudouridine synthase [Polyangiaceae bacterium]|nr:RluA family pseudouridine synthase [Polyangiaceae bacterium]
MELREERFRRLRSGIQRPEDVGDDAVRRVLRVPPEMAGMRLDRFIQSQLRATSRTRTQVIIDHSAFTTEGRRLKKNHRVQADERVVLWRPPWDADDPDIAIEEVYADDALVAVNKPPMVAVHPTARHHRSTVALIMEAQRPGEHLTLIHRLDRETSGVLLMARTRAADRAVKIQFEERRDVEKRYTAICWGTPDWERRRCDLPLAPAVDSRYRVKMAVAPEGTGQEAATTFEVLERRSRGERRYTKMRCTLHTGRQHQIRVHLAALGLPIVGDKLYGPDETIFARGADDELTDEDLATLELPRQALHASELVIDHPSTGERLALAAPLFDDMRTFWDELNR